MTGTVLPGDEGHAAGDGSVIEPDPARWGAPVAPAASDGQLLDQLAGSELLPGLTATDFGAVRDEVEVVVLEPGRALLNAGDDGSHAFVVLDGELEVVLDGERGTQHLARLGPGAVVGELGLLTGDVRSATVRAVTPSRVAALSDTGLRRLLAAHPREAEELARRATERLRRTQVLDHFNRLFGIVDPEVLDVVEQLVEWVNVPAGDQLFGQGDPGDAAYLVAAGRLRAYRRGETGAEMPLGDITRAELVGEMSLLDGEPRSASVYAVRDSQLIRFSRAAYEQLLERYPRVGVEVAQIAVRRSREGRARRPPEHQSIVVVPVTAGVDGHAFAAELAAALGDGARRVTAAQLDEEIGVAGIAQIDGDDVGAMRLAYHLEELEARHRHLVYEVDGTWDAWSRRALRWADQILLVADAEREPEPTPYEQELWELVARQAHPNVRLALLHPSGTKLPRGTPRWLEQRVLAAHHHLRRGDAEHMGRLARLLAGNGTSVVFGGGGARGFAQLGVLQVLEEQAVPIDMIGGTSIGAIMAAGPAIGAGASEWREMAVAAFRKLFDYTLPTTSLLRGERISAKLRHQLGDADITDLWLPYFCTSTNLTHARAQYHDSGPLVQAVRASIAIPGVLPPVPWEGDLLVDGGVLDNVPVEEMRRRNPTGKVIVVDVAPVEGPVAERDYGLSVSGFRSLLRRGDGAKPPNLVSTMVRSSILASVRDRQRVVEEGIADLYLDVEVDGGGMLDFSVGEQIADGGAAATRDALATWAAAGEGAARRYVRTAPVRRSLVDPEHRGRRGGVLLLTLRDLQHRLARFASVVVGVSVVISLLYLMTGLVEQFHREPRDSVEAFGAAGWLLRDGASGAFTSAATMPAATAADVDAAGAAPVVLARHSLTQGGAQTDVVVVGFEAGRLGAPVLTDGRLPGPGEVVVDDASELAVGDEAQLGVERFTVSGRTDRMTLFAGMPFVFMPLEEAQALVYRGQDLATAVLLDEVPEDVPEGFTVLDDEAVAEDAMRPLEKSISSVNLIRVLLWFVAAMIIGTMTYLSALERRRDVAVLKAVGGSTLQLGASIALQGALIALVAAAIASVLQGLLVPVFPLEVTVPASALVQVPAIAVLVSLLAGIVGLRKAVRVDPALAFAGPGS